MHRFEGARVFDQLVGYNKKVANVKSEGCPNERELAARSVGAIIAAMPSRRTRSVRC
jgi:hypothetical protein